MYVIQQPKIIYYSTMSKSCIYILSAISFIQLFPIGPKYNIIWILYNNK